MFQAQQKAVVQEANITLVNIRYLEIQYFSNFFSQFGTQCFTLAGFICGSISQTPTLDDPGCPYFFILLYNSMAALCVAFATTAMLGSVIIVVYGQGLAIRGPLGSLVKTIDGMVMEQHKAVSFFVGAVVAFALQGVGMYWIMMDQPTAIACSIIAALYSIHTFNVSSRIYNRFWWDKTRSDWRDEVDRVMELNDLAPSVDSLRDSYGEKKVEQAYRVSLHRGYLNKNSTDGQQRSVLNNMLSLMYVPKKDQSSKGSVKDSAKGSVRGDDDDAARAVEDPQLYSDAHTVVSDSPYLEINSSNNAVTFADNSSVVSESIADLKAGGYLTMKTKTKGLSMRDPWERRYFIIKHASIYYYKDRRSFELEPSKPLNIRPIELEGYALHGEDESPPFILSLIPISDEDVRKNWVFRTDTLAEFRSWREIFGKALRAANAKK